MTESAVTRIAMWSGPRNISTAMMRAWENRADTCVVDEPFYACYLTATGIKHPMQDEVLASQSSDWNEVIADQLRCQLPAGIAIQYQKHMTQHMVIEIDSQWFASVKHAFLIRHPAEVVASYGAKRGSVTAADIGFAQQHQLYNQAQKLSKDQVPIVDAKDVLSDPATCLQILCAHLNVPFDINMLNWPAGPRDSDGVWAAHWYNKVEQSTGFATYHSKDIELNLKEQQVVEQCLPFYENMYERRIMLN